MWYLMHHVTYSDPQYNDFAKWVDLATSDPKVTFTDPMVTFTVCSKPKVAYIQYWPNTPLFTST